MILTEKDFNFFRSLIYQLAGISLSSAKRELVQSRLRSRAQSLGMDSFAEYGNYLEGLPEGHEEWESFINLLTTNKTDWFREPQHFDYIVEKFLPLWMSQGKKHLDVWCAASSTGEEPYTLSLVLNQALKGRGITYKIVATDIDTRVLSQAKNGVYSKDKLWQIPEIYQDGFSMGTGEIAAWMKVKPAIKTHVEYGQLNLSHIPYPWENTFDLVLCRNVLIYFNPETIQSVVEGLYHTAQKQAVLLIAHSESLQNVKTSWKYQKPSIYSKGNLF